MKNIPLNKGLIKIIVFIDRPKKRRPKGAFLKYKLMFF